MNNSELTLTADDSPEFCGPEHLARAVQMSRRWDAAEATEGKLTKEGLTRIVELCYRVSLSTEEGRHPRFTVFVPGPAAERHLRLVARFEPPILLSAQTLRRLVPSIPAGAHALCVEQRGDEHVATGVLSLRDATDVPQLGRPAVSFGLGLPGLTLRVDGPGQARATEKGLTWELHTGHVKPVSHYAILRAVQDWFSLLALWLVRDYRDEEGAEALREREGLGDPALVFDSVWSYVLAITIAGGHGGAFAIIPDDDETSLVLKYRASGINLFETVLGYWRACFDSSLITEASLLERRAARWEASKRSMYSSAQALAHLANVDGCVVLNSRLRVLGFGAEIRVPEEDVAHSTCIDADPFTLKKRGDVDLQQFGTRHRSAYRLAAKRPGTIVFVVSQDRDLRVFYGRRDKPGEVCLWQSLGAWMAGV